MLNNSQKQKPEGNFWLGFLLGGILGAGGLFLLGTKKGRKTLKKIIEASEELEESLADIIGDLEEKIEENQEKIGNKIAEVLPEKKIDSVLQKIKSAF
jgi:Mn-dependent DtxR family transcriptional regulator